MANNNQTNFIQDSLPENVKTVIEKLIGQERSHSFSNFQQLHTKDKTVPVRVFFNPYQLVADVIPYTSKPERFVFIIPEFSLLQKIYTNINPFQLTSVLRLKNQGVSIGMLKAEGYIVPLFGEL